MAYRAQKFGPRTFPVSDAASMAHPNWFKPARIPLTIVCGPPGSGKSHYIRQHKTPRDIEICFDRLAADMFGEERPILSTAQACDVLRERNEMLAALMRDDAPHVWRRAFLAVMEPLGEWRGWWWRKVKPAQIIVLKTSIDVCEARIIDDQRNGAIRPANAKAMVRQWWDRYTPFEADTIME